MAFSAAFLRLLPGTDIPGDYLEKGMRVGLGKMPEALEMRRAAFLEFPEEMRPLVKQLPACLRDSPAHSSDPDSRRIELVASPPRLLEYGRQVARNARCRRTLLTEPDELRVMDIPPGLAEKHGLRQQPLPPDGDQTLRVQVTRM
jgi:hypothetical protein